MKVDRIYLLTKLAQLLQPSDVLNILFISFLLALTIAFSDRVVNPHLLTVLYLGMLLTAFSLIWFGRPDSNPLLYLLRKWYSVAYILLAFFSLGSIVHHILPYDVDQELIALDLALLGRHPTVFMSHFLNPYLVDLMAICYASFYFLPFVLGVVLYRKGRMRDFETFAFLVCLGFYLSDIGNILFPARGPSQTLIALHIVPLQGRWVGDVIRAVLFVLEPYRWDCFPSGHVAVTVITLALCYRLERRLFWWTLPVGMGLIISTVYLRYHYVVDLLAGVALAVGVVIGMEFFQRVWVRVRQPVQEKLPLRAYFVDKDIS